MNLLCKLLGHKPHEFTDGGYQYCERCNAQEYWDDGEITNKWNEAGILIRPYWWVKKRYLKIKDCLKKDNEYPF